MNKDPLFIVIDLFCGFGGTTKGYTTAIQNGGYIAVVAACVNHDAKAIASHWKNHPDVEHFEEDITKLYGRVINGLLYPSYHFVRLIRLVNIYRTFYPNAKVVLWASLECTNFSKAKGGMSRDADSRTLANHLDRYIHALDPDYIKIEEVVEFMAWGPVKIKIIKDNHGYESCPLVHVKVKKPVEPDPVEELLRELEPPGGQKRNKMERKRKHKKVLIEHYFTPHWIPESTKNGQYWLQWRQHIRSLGYSDDWRQLNSADFGAYTSRNRLFGIFAKSAETIAWPEPTHAKRPEGKPVDNLPRQTSLFGDYDRTRTLQKWLPVKDVLNFTDQGNSILHRKKPLSEASLERIYAGLLKFVAGGDTSFLSKYYSGGHAGKNIPVTGPSGAVTTIDHHSFIQTEKLAQPSVATAGGGTATGLVSHSPMMAISRGTCSAVSDFLMHYYSSGGQISSIMTACPTVTTRDGAALIQTEHFIEKQYTRSIGQSIHLPAGTLMPKDKNRLLTTVPLEQWKKGGTNPSIVKKRLAKIGPGLVHFLINPSWGGNPGSVEQPCCVIVARQDKAPLYFVQAETGKLLIAIYDTDSSATIRIKLFMVAFGLVDIKMRMLRVPELLRIQGFPDTYKMVGNQGDQKKFIGNSVVPQVVKAWAEALAEKTATRKLATAA